MRSTRTFSLFVFAAHLLAPPLSHHIKCVCVSLRVVHHTARHESLRDMPPGAVLHSSSTADVSTTHELNASLYVLSSTSTPSSLSLLPPSRPLFLPTGAPHLTGPCSTKVSRTIKVSHEASSRGLLRQARVRNQGPCDIPALIHTGDMPCRVHAMGGDVV